MSHVAVPRHVVTRARSIFEKLVDPAQAGHDMLNVLRSLQRRHIEALVDASVALLDELDGDSDFEPGGAEDDFGVTYHWTSAGPGCPLADSDELNGDEYDVNGDETDGTGAEDEEQYFFHVVGIGPGCLVADDDRDEGLI